MDQLMEEQRKPAFKNVFIQYLQDGGEQCA